MAFLKSSRLFGRPVWVSALLAGALGLSTAAQANVDPAATKQVPAPSTTPPPAIAAQPPQSAADQARKESEVRARFNIDRQLAQARAAKDKGDWSNAQASMLDAARQLKLMGYENDQVKVLRDMTLEPTAGKPEQAQQYVRAGQQALADFYYRVYLNNKPRDAQWLLEALGWANYANDEALLKRFAARVPDKAHENIDERGRQRGLELKMDDALYQAFDLIRVGKPEQVKATLKDWPYPINARHTQLGTSLLHMAVWYDKPEAVKALVEQYKADVNLGDNDNDTPLDYANHLKLGSLADYLKSKGGKSNASQKNASQKNASQKNAKPAAVAPVKP